MFSFLGKLKAKKVLILDVIVLTLLVYKGLSFPLPKIIGGGSCQHFIYLAEAFLRGHTHIEKAFPCFYDVIQKDGKIFLPFGPMPAILLMPLVAVFGLSINEAVISLLATIINIFLVWRIAGYLGVKNLVMRIWLIVLFVFGSLYFIYFHWDGPWSVAHPVTIVLIMLAIDRGLRKSGEFLAGLFLGMAFLTRTPVIFSLVFFPILWWIEKESLTIFLQRVLLFTLGLVGPLFLFLDYNFVRFGNVWESGYSLTILGTPTLTEARKAGLFSLAHVPKNLYIMLLKGLDSVPGIDSPTLISPYVSSNPWGMSIFLSTPALLYIFTADLRRRLVVACWVAIGFTLIPILTYYGIGYAQYGYRYSLDFFPFLFILTAMGMKDNFNIWPRMLIALGVLLNTYWR